MPISSNRNRIGQYYQDSLILLGSGYIGGGVVVSGFFHNETYLYPMVDILTRFNGGPGYEGQKMDIVLPKVFLPPSVCLFTLEVAGINFGPKFINYYMESSMMNYWLNPLYAGINGSYITKIGYKKFEASQSLYSFTHESYLIPYSLGV